MPEKPSTTWPRRRRSAAPAGPEEIAEAIGFPRLAAFELLQNGAILPADGRPHRLSRTSLQPTGNSEDPSEAGPQPSTLSQPRM